MSTRATAGFNVFIERSVVRVVPHIVADRLTATEPARPYVANDSQAGVPDLAITFKRPDLVDWMYLILAGRCPDAQAAQAR